MIESVATALAALCLLGTPTPAKGVSDADLVESVVDDCVRQLYIVSDRHWHKGEYKHLINMNRMVIAARPTYIEPYVNAGWLLWSMDRDDEAVALYDQGIAANPNSYALYNEKGFYLITRKKDWKNGLPLLETAISKPDCAKIVFHTLAHAYERNGQLDKALATWNRAANDPNNPGHAAARVNRDRVQRLIDERK
ncbi:MAG: tetratricopeptide repeat protein [Chthonomonadales bacterium]|nr:tetratricopeptide repeat protein [Chthonomonadales bacterium]